MRLGWLYVIFNCFAQALVSTLLQLGIQKGFSHRLRCGDEMVRSSQLAVVACLALLS